MKVLRILDRTCILMTVGPSHRMSIQLMQQPAAAALSLPSARSLQTDRFIT